MASYNKVMLMGNLTRDPEYKQLSSGQAVCRLGLAVNRQYKNRQNSSMVQEVCYIDIDVWGAQAESCRQYLKKGQQVMIEGRLKLDSWDDAASGQKRSKHSIVADRVIFLGGAGAESDSGEVERPAAEESDFKLNMNNPVERDLMQQLESAKTKIRGAEKITKRSSDVSGMGTEMNFQDAPPFEDDLPF
jgi:single-strand DNA-binding protein